MLERGLIVDIKHKCPVFLSLYAAISVPEVVSETAVASGSGSGSGAPGEPTVRETRAAAARGLASLARGGGPAKRTRRG